MARQFINTNTAHYFGIPVHQLKDPIHVQTLDGKPVDELVINYQTAEIRLHTSARHIKNISFLVMESHNNLTVFSLPWLQHYNPRIAWDEKEITAWSITVMRTACLVSPNKLWALNAMLSSMKCLVYSRACMVPPHKPYDCAIDLLSGTTPVWSHTYPLSSTEYKAM